MRQRQSIDRINQLRTGGSINSTGDGWVGQVCGYGGRTITTAQNTHFAFSPPAFKAQPDALQIRFHSIPGRSSWNTNLSHTSYETWGSGGDDENQIAKLAK